MMRLFFSGAVVLSAMAGSVSAQDRSPELAFRLAVESGICGPRGVLSAAFNISEVIEATCNPDATGSDPLAGGLAPALAGGFGIIALAAAGGGDSTPDTQ